MPCGAARCGWLCRSTNRAATGLQSSPNVRFEPVLSGHPVALGCAEWLNALREERPEALHEFLVFVE